MTEIPEHLLKRAAQRRAAMGEGGAAPADAPAADSGTAAPADAPAAAVEKAKAAPAPLPTLDEAEATAKPDTPVVAAAKARRRIPFWAAPVLAALPLWGVIYVASVQPPPAGDTDPLVIGKEAYTTLGCSGCHGADGGGGTGAKLSNGEVIKTFPDPLQQVYWIHNGATNGARPDGTYGDAARKGGAQNVSTLAGVMPGFPDVPPEEMAALIIYIREGLSGGTAADDPKFNAETYAADPAALAKMIEDVAALKPNDPDSVSALDGAEES